MQPALTGGARGSKPIEQRAVGSVSSDRPCFICVTLPSRRHRCRDIDTRQVKSTTLIVVGTPQAMGPVQQRKKCEHQYLER